LIPAILYFTSADKVFCYENSTKKQLTPNRYHIRSVRPEIEKIE